MTDKTIRLFTVQSPMLDEPEKLTILYSPNLSGALAFIAELANQTLVFGEPTPDFEVTIGTEEMLLSKFEAMDIRKAAHVDQS